LSAVAVGAALVATLANLYLPFDRKLPEAQRLAAKAVEKGPGK
jgi:hypothetical protein